MLGSTRTGPTAVRESCHEHLYEDAKSSNSRVMVAQHVLAAHTPQQAPAGLESTAGIEKSSRRATGRPHRGSEFDARELPSCLLTVALGRRQRTGAGTARTTEDSAAGAERRRARAIDQVEAK